MTLSPDRRPLFRVVFLLTAVLAGASGCRQKMAEAPYYRPYDECDFYEKSDVEPMSSARPLERGVIHRSQYLETDPLVTGLTREEWGRAYESDMKAEDMQKTFTAPAPKEDLERGIGAPRYDQRKKDGKAAYVEDYPFPITSADLKRGQERYSIYCVECHGPLGNGQGKIWERGYLNPTSFHTTIVGKNEIEVPHPRDVPLGYSRGYSLWGIQIPLREVPVGYIFEVVTKGFGGMPNYAAQIPPADRWRIIAYVRVLQYSQHAPAAEAKGPTAGGKK